MANVGIAGWTIPRQFASDFPAGGSHLERYGRVLCCCEINSSFYRSHRVTTWERWANAVPANFRFAVKMPRIITHEKSLVGCKEDLSLFLHQTKLLGSKLGPILLQTPPKFNFDPLSASQFFSVLRMMYAGQVVIEPRHASWFSEEAEQLLIAFEIARAGADPAIVPVAALPGGSRTVTYFRMHGSPRKYYSSYPEATLRELAVAMWSGGGEHSDTWCIFDNTASGAAVGDALRLNRLLKEESRA